MANTDYVGWRFILPPLQESDLLWCESQRGDAAEHLSAFVRELTVLRRDVDDSNPIAEHSAEGNVTRVRIDEAECRLPFSDESFDGAVIVDGSWLCDCSASAKRALSSHTFRLVSELHRVVRNGGYLCVMLPNKYCLSNMLGMMLATSPRCGQVRSYPTATRLKHTMLKAGFHDARSYRMLSSAEAIDEVVVGGQYRPTKNAFAFKQKLKAVLLNSWLTDFISQSQGLLAVKGGCRTAFLDSLIEKLYDDLPDFPKGARHFAVRRYLVLPGKVILSIGDSFHQYGERIVILPLATTVRDRLRDEARILKAFQSTSTNIGSLVPKFYGEYELAGQPYFVQQEMPGTSVDIPVSSLEAMSARAAELMTEFHVRTAVDVVVDSRILGELFFEPLGRVVDALGPACSVEAARIGEIAGGLLRGKPFKLVWMHGDFKIENLLFDPGNLQVTGIIDWDLARRNGFPLGDMLYLIAYNRVIRNGGQVEEVILDCIIPHKLSEGESALLDGYMTRLGLNTDLFDLLVGIFCIHHLAYRRDVRRCPPETVARMRSVLAAMGLMMACKYGHGSLQ